LQTESADSVADESARTRLTDVRTRRGFLAGASVAFASLSGCTFSVNLGGDESADQTATPQTATQSSPPAETPAPTQPPPPTDSTTPSETPPTTDQPELIVVTAQPKPVPVTLVTPAAERYRIERLYLYVEAAADAAFDGPNTEEIYGEIDVSATDGETTVATTAGQGRVWDVDENNPREISAGGGRLLSLDFTPIEFVFPDPTLDRSAAYIEVSASFYEADKGLNDDDEFVMFNSDDRWYLDDNPSPDGYVADNGESYFKLEFAAGGSLLNLSYNVTRV
jgi:hypothetical protein